MAERSFPLENTSYTAEEAQLWFATRTTGVYGTDDNLRVTADGSGLLVNVSPGLAWLAYGSFRGVAYGNTEATTKAISPANASFPRIDRVIVRYSATDNTVLLRVIEGAPASSPTPPDIVRTQTTYDISLAQVYVAAGAASIAADAVTDERADGTVCGKMADSISPFPSPSLAFTTTAVITTTWTGSAAPYTQEVDVPGLLATDNPIVDPVYSATLATAEAEMDAYALIYRIETYDGKIKVYATDKTTTPLTIMLKEAR